MSYFIGDDAAQLIKTIESFDDSNVFLNEEVPQAFLQSSPHEFIYIQPLNTTDIHYRSDRRDYDFPTVQVDLYTKSNATIKDLVPKIFKLFDSHLYGCFFDESGHDLSHSMKRYTWRFSKERKF